MARSRKNVSIGRELASARRSLRALEQSLARLAAQVRDINRSNAARPAGKPRRKLKLMPARLKALRLHGRYLGYMRQLKSRAKAEVLALRAKKEVRAGIGLVRGRRIPGLDLPGFASEVISARDQLPVRPQLGRPL